MYKIVETTIIEKRRELLTKIKIISHLNKIISESNPDTIIINIKDFIDNELEKIEKETKILNNIQDEYLKNK